MYTEKGSIIIKNPPIGGFFIPKTHVLHKILCKTLDLGVK